MVPRSLRIWFFIHFLVDYLFAIPLFLYPVPLLSILGWNVIDPIATRIVAAALFAIGGISLLSRNSNLAVYQSILTLKIIWSFGAIVALAIALIGRDLAIGTLLGFLLFCLFGIVWVYYRVKLWGLRDK